MSRMQATCIERTVIVTLVMLIPVFVAAQGIDDRSLPGIEKLQPELLAKMETQTQFYAYGPGRPHQQTYRIIVSLQAQFEEQTMDYQSPEGMAQVQRHAEELQDAVLAARTQGSLHILHRYQSFYGFSAEADREAILDLIQLGEVEFVEEILVMQTMDAEAHQLTNLTQVHRAGYTGKEITIAIIDDGIDHDHVAFGAASAWPNEKIIGGYDFADNDGDPRIDCIEQAHGTAVAGVAAGNGGGVTGAAPDAKLVFLKVQSAANCGQSSLAGDIVAAVDWVITNRDTYDIKLISMSFGGSAYGSASACDNVSSAFRRAINAAHAAGIIVMAAAGNEGLCNQIAFPSCLTNVISVGATYDADIGAPGFCVGGDACEGEFDATCALSGRQACVNHNTDGDLVTCYSNSAEILDILAPAHCATTAKAGGGVHSCFGGTSSAVPFAAGVAAALLEAGDHDLNNDTMRNVLADSGIELLDSKNNLVKARIDAQAAMESLVSDDSVTGPIEVGQVSLNHSWQTVNFKHEFHDPIVIAKPASYDNEQPGVIRIRDVTPSSYQIRIQEWDYLDGVHHFETVTYLVVERGRWELPQGGSIEAGTVNVSNTSRKRHRPTFVHVEFGQAFSEPPVVFSTVGTFHEEDTVATRQRRVTTTGLQLAIQEQERNIPTHAQETVNWVAWEEGQGVVDNRVSYEAGHGRQVSHRFSTINFTAEFMATPCFLADMQTFVGYNTANLRYQRLTRDNVEVQVDEEQSRDREISHVREEIGFLAFDCQG